MALPHINLSALEKAAGGAQMMEQTVSFYHAQKGTTNEEIAMSTANYLANLALGAAGFFDSLANDAYWGPALKAMSFYANFDSMLKQCEKTAASLQHDALKADEPNYVSDESENNMLVATARTAHQLHEVPL